MTKDHFKTKLKDLETSNPGPGSRLTRTPKIRSLVDSFSVGLHLDVYLFPENTDNSLYSYLRHTHPLTEDYRITRPTPGDSSNYGTTTMEGKGVLGEETRLRHLPRGLQERVELSI